MSKLIVISTKGLTFHFLPISFHIDDNLTSILKYKKEKSIGSEARFC